MNKIQANSILNSLHNILGSKRNKKIIVSNSMYDIEDNMGVQFSLFINGKLESFTVGLIKTQSHGSKFIDYEIVYFKDNTDTYIYNTVSSGGATNFLVESYMLKLHSIKDDMSIVTKDPIKALKLNKQYKEEKRLEEQKEKERKANANKILIEEFKDKEVELENNFSIVYNARIDGNTPILENEFCYSGIELISNFEGVITKSGRISSKPIKEISQDIRIDPKIIKKELLEAINSNKKMIETFNSRYKELLSEVN